MTRLRNTDLAPRSTLRLRGEVTRLTLLRKKDGTIRHDTAIRFTEPDSPFKSVRVEGSLTDHPSGTWDAELLTALRSRYDVPGLPEPRWIGSRR